MNKGLPPLPYIPQEQRIQRENDTPPSSHFNEPNPNVDTMAIERDISPPGSLPELLREDNSSSSTFPKVLPPPPKPPMSKSEQKVLQLTGHDVRYDRTRTEERSEFIDSADSSSSSGSRYSQEDQGSLRTPSPNTYRSSSSAPVTGATGPYNQKLSGYIDDDKNKSSKLAKVKETSYSAGEAQALPSFRQGPARTYSTEPVILHDFIEETQKDFGLNHATGPGYSTRMTDPSLSHWVPAPLTLRQKAKAQTSNKGVKRVSLFETARDSMARGIEELTGAPRGKDSSIPENFAIDPPAPETQKRNFASGKHPLKSPFPFYNSRRNSDPEESENKVRKRFSGVIKRLPGGKSSSVEPTIIPNSARAPDGPDTPLPRKSGFMATLPSVDLSEHVQHGNEHLQEVYERAKKSLKIKTSDEKRRESLKKKIVLVGMSDQSPGMGFFNLLLADTNCL
jgi:hypothetical protein